MNSAALPANLSFAFEFDEDLMGQFSFEYDPNSIPEDIKNALVQKNIRQKDLPPYLLLLTCCQKYNETSTRSLKERLLVKRVAQKVFNSLFKESKLH